MAPHAVPSIPPRHVFVNLDRFMISTHSFLPERNPCKKLSDAYYEPWESLVRHLPKLIQAGAIRKSIATLPVLSTSSLKSEVEWRRAYAMLAFLAHANVWGGHEPDDVRPQLNHGLHSSWSMEWLASRSLRQILPSQITLPFLRVSEHLELPLVLTYAGGNLWNFSCAGSDFSKPELLSTLFSFTGTESESWFFLISAAMEAKAASILHTMLGALAAVQSREYTVITEAFHELRHCIDEVGHLLMRMPERCDPMVFYHQIRPFLAGSKNMEAAGLPRGVFYEEGDGKGTWRQLRGGSNGQSSLIAFFDIVLGVEHQSPGGGGSQTNYHAEVREYMPGPHQRFLLHAARIGSIRDLAMVSPTTDEQRRLRGAYVAATDALSRFRDKHIQIVARYIILPSKQKLPPPLLHTDISADAARNVVTSAALGKNLASTSSSRHVDEELTGTGGTKLVPFLRMARDRTCRAAKLEEVVRHD